MPILVFLTYPDEMGFMSPECQEFYITSWTNKYSKTLIFFFPVLCCNSDFTQFLYSSDQMPVRTVFPGLYTLLGFKIMVRWSPQKCKIRGLL